MENDSLQPSAKRISRKTTLKRSTFNISSKFQLCIPTYSAKEMKLLAMLSLINIFDQQKFNILRNYEDQMESKLTQTGTHFCRNSSTLRLEPTKKQIIQLNHASNLLQSLRQAIQNYLKTYIKPQARKSLNSSLFCLSLATPTESAPLNGDQAFKTKQECRHPIEISLKAEMKPDNKENCERTQNSNMAHRRYWSNVSFASRNSSPAQDVSKSRRKQKCFLVKKKQQLEFLQKITVDFNSEEAQFKALVETMAVFVKNLNRANYYLKVIDHNSDKCDKITIYLKELIKIFSSIAKIFTALSQIHKALNMVETTSLSKSQLGHIPPLVQQYYEKSNETMRIMRHFSLSPVFGLYVTPYKKECSKLIYLFVEGRYTLRYLQKEIENLECAKKQYGKLSKWQKAYRIKFLPKNTIC